MTYREWITATLAKFDVSDSDIDLILVNQASLIPEPSATVDVMTAKRAVCKEIAVYLPLANIGEGGYSISWNWDALKLWYNSTCAELGLPDYSKPKIKNASNIW